MCFVSPFVFCFFFTNLLKFFSSASVSQVKLEEALSQATDFHNSLQDFINWLTQAEQTLNMVSPASLILETIMFQIDEHKVKPLADDFPLTSSDLFASCCGQLGNWENISIPRKCSACSPPLMSWQLQQVGKICKLQCSCYLLIFTCSAVFSAEGGRAMHC